jgi:hypothetical protein
MIRSPFRLNERTLLKGKSMTSNSSGAMSGSSSQLKIMELINVMLRSARTLTRFMIFVFDFDVMISVTLVWMN